MERSRLLFGCYRKGDANDPVIYTAAVALVLSQYPEDVVIEVTHPTKGIPSKATWMPSVAEVKKACDELMRPRIDYQARQARIAQQLRERAEWETAHQRAPQAAQTSTPRGTTSDQ